MDFGCHLPVFGPIATRDSVLAFARRMEALGYDSLWASDHVALPHAIRSRYPYSETGQFPLPADANFLEPLTTLALVAGVTERVRLGTTILVLPHRHPVLAAKMLATLDHLSGGRVILGAGVGWMREEIELLGAPFDGRGAWSDEAIRIMRACWATERASHHGRFFSFDEVSIAPLPLRRTIPVWIGGHTPSAFKRVVALGDGWHAAFPSVEALEKGLALLREECSRQGRRFEDLTLSVRAGLSIRSAPAGPDRKPLQGSPEQIVSDLSRYRDLGVHTVLFETRLRDLEDMVGIYEAFARDIRPRLSA
ncbi:MAG: LLM class F420-dependent oxidoreductase [Candidatus Rokubacteria bacterium]|nr:LLM class F420-dependent oxidoreductase [Candidatus Rokubacteria bacterium]